MARARGRFASAALAAFLSTSGCLDCDEQEFVVAYDAKRRQLDAQVVYRGLFSGATMTWSWFEDASDVVEDVEGTGEILDRLLAGRPIFGLLGGVPIDLGELRELEDARHAKLARALTVDHGKFFRDEAGRLCGWQHLQVRDVPAALELLDALLREKLTSEGGARVLRRNLGCDDAASSLRIAEAVEKKARFFEAVDGALVWHVPAGDAAARALSKRIETAPSLDSLFVANAKRASPGEDEKRSAVSEVVRARSSDGENDAKLVFAAFLRAIGATSKLAPTGVDLVLFGEASGSRPIAFRPPDRKVDRFDLAPHLAKRKVEVRTDVTAETLRRDFDERCAR